MFLCFYALKCIELNYLMKWKSDTIKSVGMIDGSSSNELEAMKPVRAR